MVEVPASELWDTNFCWFCFGLQYYDRVSYIPGWDSNSWHNWRCQWSFDSPTSTSTAGLRHSLKIINFLCVCVKYISKYVLWGRWGEKENVGALCPTLSVSASSPWDLWPSIESNRQPARTNNLAVSLPIPPLQHPDYRCTQPCLIFTHVLGTWIQVVLLA